MARAAVMSRATPHQARRAGGARQARGGMGRQSAERSRERALHGAGLARGSG